MEICQYENSTGTSDAHVVHEHYFTFAFQQGEVVSVCGNEKILSHIFDIIHLVSVDVAHDCCKHLLLHVRNFDLALVGDFKRVVQNGTQSSKNKLVQIKLLSIDEEHDVAVLVQMTNKSVGRWRFACPVRLFDMATNDQRSIVGQQLLTAVHQFVAGNEIRKAVGMNFVVVQEMLIVVFEDPDVSLFLVPVQNGELKSDSNAILAGQM